MAEPTEPLQLFALKMPTAWEWDGAEGFVIAHRTPGEARQMAAKRDRNTDWRDPAKATCKAIGTAAQTRPGVVLEAIHDG